METLWLPCWWTIVQFITNSDLEEGKMMMEELHAVLMHEYSLQFPQETH